MNKFVFKDSKFLPVNFVNEQRTYWKIIGLDELEILSILNSNSPRDFDYPDYQTIQGDLIE